jgi:hypothetical protein
MLNIGRHAVISLALASLALAPLLVSSAPAIAADAANPGRYAELPGVKLWFTDTAGMGTPIVLLHANTGTSASWDALARRNSITHRRQVSFVKQA